MTRRIIPPPSPPADSFAATVTSESGFPFRSTTRPETICPRGIVSTMPAFRSPGARRSVALFADG